MKQVSHELSAKTWNTITVDFLVNIKTVITRQKEVWISQLVLKLTGFYDLKHDDVICYFTVPQALQ